MKLILERKNKRDESEIAPGVLLTPRLGSDYWLYRVRLSDSRAILGFPKFLTVGIGFAVEEDWNTNLPYRSDSYSIFNHIRHNKGDDRISDDDCLKAIAMIQEAIALDSARAGELEAMG